jgi:hypothetical protein
MIKHRAWDSPVSHLACKHEQLTATQTQPTTSLSKARRPAELHQPLAVHNLTAAARQKNSQTVQVCAKAPCTGPCQACMYITKSKVPLHSKNGHHKPRTNREACQAHLAAAASFTLLQTTATRPKHHSTCKSGTTATKSTLLAHNSTTADLARACHTPTTVKQTAASQP